MTSGGDAAYFPALRRARLWAELGSFQTGQETPALSCASRCVRSALSRWATCTAQTSVWHGTALLPSALLETGCLASLGPRGLPPCLCEGMLFGGEAPDGCTLTWSSTLPACLDTCSFCIPAATGRALTSGQ